MTDTRIKISRLENRREELEDMISKETDFDIIADLSEELLIVSNDLSYLWYEDEVECDYNALDPWF